MLVYNLACIVCPGKQIGFGEASFANVTDVGDGGATKTHNCESNYDDPTSSGPSTLFK